MEYRTPRLDTRSTALSVIPAGPDGCEAVVDENRGHGSSLRRLVSPGQKRRRVWD